MKPDERYDVDVELLNPETAGAIRVPLLIDGRATGARWPWMAAGARTVTRLPGSPLYRPGKYAVRVANSERTVRVQKAPAAFRYGDFCETDWPRQPGSPARVSVPIRNVGGSAGLGKTGLAMHYRIPKYGAYKVWSWDSDGDGLPDVRSDGGHAALPVWYRFEKRGRTLRAFSSTAGKTWRLCGLPGRTEFTSDLLGARQDVGFFAGAWSKRGQLARAEFSDFTLRSR